MSGKAQNGLNLSRKKCNAKKHPSPTPVKNRSTLKEAVKLIEHLGWPLVLTLKLLYLFIQQLDCGFVYWRVELEISNSGKQIYIHI